METDIDQRLRAIEKKLDDNTGMVRKLYRSQRRANAVKLVYWLILIILGIVSIYLIKPYFSQLGKTYGLGNGSKESTSYSDLLNSIK